MSDERSSIFSGSVISDGGLPELTDAEIQRYSRHLILPQVGVEGQKKLKKAKVLLIGSGALGSPVALYLLSSAVFLIEKITSFKINYLRLSTCKIH